MRILCILMLLVLSNIILAQSSIPVPWEKQYNYQEYDFAADMCAGNGGGAVIVGGDWEDTNYSDMRCRVTRLSRSGRVLWTTWLDFGDNYPVYEGVCRNEFRQTYVTVGTHDYNESDRELIFGEFNEKGHLVRTNWFDNYERGLDIIQLDDGGYAALVLKRESSWPYNVVPFVMKTDYQFNRIWETQLDLPFFCGLFPEISGLWFPELQPGNGLCLSVDGNYILAGYTYYNSSGIFPPYYYWGLHCVNSLTVEYGEIEAVSDCDYVFDRQYIGVEIVPTLIPGLPPRYVLLTNPLINLGEGVFENTDEFIVLTTFDEDLNFLDDVQIDPPGGYIGIRAYEFELCSGGYMITGMVKDYSDQWHMWIGRTNDSFELQDSYYGSANTGSFGEVNFSCNQMGGCVTEAGHFMAAGAEYLPNGHTDYNVMFEPYVSGIDSGDASLLLDLGEPEESTNGLSVYRNSGLNHFSIQFHGEISGEPVADVYSIYGRKVRTLHGTRDTESSVSFTFDGSSSEGNQLPSGVYIVMVNAGNSIEAATFTLLQ